MQTIDASASFVMATRSDRGIIVGTVVYYNELNKKINTFHALGGVRIHWIVVRRRVQSRTLQTGEKTWIIITYR